MVIDFLQEAAAEQYQYLSKRGLDPKAVQQLGWEIAGQSRLEELKFTAFNIDKAILMPVTNIHGEPTGAYGARIFYPKATGASFLEGGSSNRPKYLSPKGQKMHIFYPQNIDWDKLPRGERIYICESYVKAAVVAKMGYYAIGISGCWGWGKAGTSHAGLYDLPWRDMGLIPVISWDSNVREGNPRLYTSVQRLLTRLQIDTGVRGIWLPLPSPPGTEDDWGIDDFYMAHGEQITREYLESEPTFVEGDIGLHIEALDSEVAYVENIKKVVRRDTGTLMSVSEFTGAAFANRVILHDDREVSIPRRWLAWEHRTDVARLEYVPGGESLVAGDYYNLWRGMGCSPVGGNVSLWTEWLEAAIPSEQERIWFEQWLAWPLQNLGGKLTSCVFLSGPSGVGKGWLAYIMKKVYGVENYAGIQLGDLGGAFNAHFAAKQLVIVEECEYIDRNSRVYVAMKDIITNEHVQYHPKGVTPTQISNHINLLLEGNDISALGKIDAFDRRIGAIHIARHVDFANDATFWRGRWDWVDNGGAEAIYDHLLGLDMAGFDPKGVPPHTEAKDTMIGLGMSDKEQWVESLLAGDTDILTVGDITLSGVATTRELLWAYYGGEEHPKLLDKKEVLAFGKLLTKAEMRKATWLGGQGKNAGYCKTPETKVPELYWDLGGRCTPTKSGLTGASYLKSLEWRSKLYQGGDQNKF